MTWTNDIHLVPLVPFAHKLVCSHQTGALHATNTSQWLLNLWLNLKDWFFSMMVLMVDLNTKICLFPQITKRLGLCYKIHRTVKANKRQLSSAYHLWERKSILWTKFITLCKRTANLLSVVCVGLLFFIYLFIFILFVCLFPFWIL